MSYNSSLTVKYKQGYILSANINGKEEVRVILGRSGIVKHCKSYRAAKILITKYEARNGHN